MELRKAQASDFESVLNFYWTLIDDMQGCKTFPKWEKGIYPSNGDLMRYIESGELYLTEIGGEIAGAFALTHISPEGYEQCDWLVNAPQEKVSVIHILAVGSRFHRKGIGGFLVEQAKELCRKTGQASLRLDVIHNNQPAKNLYIKHGFVPHKMVELYYEDVGRLQFLLCEYVL